MDGSATIPQTRFIVPNPGDPEVLVIGLGNILLGDDGIGVHVVRRLVTNRDIPPGLRPLDGGTLGFRLMDAFARCWWTRRNWGSPPAPSVCLNVMR
jgi:hypothetical protein